jgi:biopolymer transport protein ExbB/TolQ
MVEINNLPIRLAPEMLNLQQFQPFFDNLLNMSKLFFGIVIGIWLIISLVKWINAIIFNKKFNKLVRDVEEIKKEIAKLKSLKTSK